ncbi:hypothetical protein M5689_002441 [Euphorbia peplus]|nr:hypothetical protein M5689_002441 [Euphorbia peplus]
MEGSVSEEPKSMQIGAEASHGVKRKRIKLSSGRVQRGTDASQADMAAAGSEIRQVNPKRVKKKKKHVSGRFVRVRRGADASQGEMGGGSKHHQVKRKRVTEDSVSGVQCGVDATHGQVFVSPASHVVKCKRIQEKCVTRVQSGQEVRRLKFLEIYDKLIKKGELRRANMALEFYQKSHKDAEFEIIAVLHVDTAYLTPPGYGPKRAERWCHLRFIAKPKNADCGDVSPKFFFAELVDDNDDGKFYATYCSTFNPRHPGSKHDCVFCMPGQRLHPRDGYRVGRAPWKEERIKKF